MPCATSLIQAATATKEKAENRALANILGTRLAMKYPALMQYRLRQFLQVDQQPEPAPLPLESETKADKGQLRRQNASFF